MMVSKISHYMVTNLVIAQLFSKCLWCLFCGSKWCWLGLEFGTGGARFVVLKCQPALAAHGLQLRQYVLFNIFSPFSGALQLHLLHLFHLHFVCLSLGAARVCFGFHFRSFSLLCVGNRGLCAHGPRLNYHLPGANSYK